MDKWGPRTNPWGAPLLHPTSLKGTHLFQLFFSESTRFQSMLTHFLQYLVFLIYAPVSVPPAVTMSKVFWKYRYTPSGSPLAILPYTSSDNSSKFVKRQFQFQKTILISFDYIPKWLAISLLIIDSSISPTIDVKLTGQEFTGFCLSLFLNKGVTLAVFQFSHLGKSSWSASQVKNVLNPK